MKRENRYKKLFQVDEDDLGEDNLLETTHIARDDEFADEGDKFIEFVAEDVHTGQVHPRVLQQLNEDPAGLGRDYEMGEDGELKRKSKREVFKEMIRKSKYEKMVRQKANAEQTDKVQQLDNMFSSLFPELNMSGLDKKKSTDLKDYDKLRAQLQFEPSLTPVQPVSEKNKNGKKNEQKRKKIDADQLESEADGAEEESSEQEAEESDVGEEEGEEGEEEDYESYEGSGEDVERIHEGELKVRKFNMGAMTKKDRIEENYNKAMKNLKLLGDLEDELLGKYMKDIDDIEEGDEEEGDDEEGGEELDDAEADEEGDIEDDGEDEFGEEEDEEGEEEEN